MHQQIPRLDVPVHDVVRIDRAHRPQQFQYRIVQNVTERRFVTHPERSLEHVQVMMRRDGIGRSVLFVLIDPILREYVLQRRCHGTQWTGGGGSGTVRPDDVEHQPFVGIGIGIYPYEVGHVFFDGVVVGGGGSELVEAVSFHLDVVTASFGQFPDFFGVDRTIEGFVGFGGCRFGCFPSEIEEFLFGPRSFCNLNVIPIDIRVAFDDEPGLKMA